MYCFKCKNIIMKKMEYYDVVVDMCQICGGVWIDKNELSLIAENYINKKININSKSYNTIINIDIENMLERDNFLSNKKQCPKCMKISMIKIFWNNMEIDKCCKCHGIFLDGNEFPVAMNIYIKKKTFLGKINRFIQEKILRLKEKNI